jgi:chaperonin cofactor prefoldin
MNIQDRISSLLKEQETLVKKYNELSQELQNIMTRVVQIQGALNELQKLSKEENQGNE